MTTPRPLSVLSLKTRISDIYEAIYGFQPELTRQAGTAKGTLQWSARKWSASSASVPVHKGLARTTEHAALWSLADRLANVFLQQERKRARIRRQLAEGGLGSQVLHADITSAQRDIEHLWRPTPYAPSPRSLQKQRTAEALAAKKAKKAAEKKAAKGRAQS